MCYPADEPRSKRDRYGRNTSLLRLAANICATVVVYLALLLLGAGLFVAVPIGLLAGWAADQGMKRRRYARRFDAELRSLLDG